MAKEIRFPEGMRYFAPRENAPDFVLANISINRDVFIAFLSKEGEKVQIDVLRSKSTGKPYLSVSDFKPKQEPKQDLFSDASRVVIPGEEETMF